MTQIDTDEIRNDTDRQVNKYGYAPMSREEMFFIADELDRLRTERMELRGAIIETLPWLTAPIPGDIARYCRWALKHDTTPSPLQGEIDSLRQQLTNANKRIAELEEQNRAYRKGPIQDFPPEMPENPQERHPGLAWLLRRNQREGD